MKPTIVISGVNLVDMGPLTIFKNALVSLSTDYSGQYRIVALVHRKTLFDTPGIEYLEFPQVKASWWRRICFEYWECRHISKALNPHLWFAMHDMTPDVSARIRAVYCHNPAPFHSFRLQECFLDPTFGLHTLFYRFLYRIHIKSNNYVVVQQDWLRSEFKSRYGIQNVIVAHPSVGYLSACREMEGSSKVNPSCIFFFPAYPRAFKNFEQIFDAARRLEAEGINHFAVLVTMDGSENRYATKLAKEYKDLTTVRWIGLMTHEDVMRQYQGTDCLIFPSRLETWGLPITEFKATGKPILAVDLPYARETVGQYDKAAFFPLDDDEKLAEVMKQAIRGKRFFGPVAGREIEAPFSQGWTQLWRLLLREGSGGGATLPGTGSVKIPTE